MSKERKAQIITVAALLAALGIGLARKAGFRHPDFRSVKLASEAGGVKDRSPEEAIYAMVNAARTGDVRAYLACYTGPLQATLRQVLAESGESDFAQSLRDSHSAIKGIAVSALQPMAGPEAGFRVEYTYQDHSTAQEMYLEKDPNGWKISRADNEELSKTLIPYGTPIKQLLSRP